MTLERATERAMTQERATADWVRVQTALDSRWDFRTVDGIVKDTKLSPKVVKGLLRQHRTKIRKTLSQDGRDIYALKSRPRRTLREILATIQMFAGR